MDEAISHAAQEFYGVANPRVRWVATLGSMGIHHEVVPKEEALTCLDCHGANGRVDWCALGYGTDPILSRWCP
ncbi:MAG: hypothetical protein NZ869_09915 [Thermoanaerobaculum sp.]|nr:hypothetical protein [Thermoanaerobaculum sp.]MDW7967146.1 hypothetical protein [Thermoanaerobaculum sp.]